MYSEVFSRRVIKGRSSLVSKRTRSGLRDMPPPRKKFYKGTIRRTLYIRTTTRWHLFLDTSYRYNSLQQLLCAWPFHFASQPFDVRFRCVAQTIAGQMVDAA